MKLLISKSGNKGHSGAQTLPLNPPYIYYACAGIRT